MLMFNRKFALFIMLGISSAIPYGLTMSSLSLWLGTIGFSAGAIGMLALVGLPYSFSFLWSSVMDGRQVPFLGAKLGHRRSWLILSQIFVAFGILLFIFVDPLQNLNFLIFVATLLTLFSSFADVAIGSFRIQFFEKDHTGNLASAYIAGYRVGLIVTSLLLVHLVNYFESWQISYGLTSVIIFLGVLILVFSEKEEEIEIPKIKLRDAYLDVLRRENWIKLIIFILIFRLSDCYVSVLSNKFFLDLGFSKEMIVDVHKTTGLVATILGAVFGGMLLQRFSLQKMLFASVIIQSVSNLFFLIQFQFGPDPLILVLVTFIEKFASSIAFVVLLTFIGRQCNLKFSAAQNAIFSSISLLDRSLLAAPAGFLAQIWGWENFFLFSAILSLPCILLINALKEK